MFLKRIEINGFKSFANKTEILLNNKITGIVGPNGSGKSNIADAIRWVLGEQSSKNLRGNKMEDVIFNGTQSRAKKPFCEVSLIFDNEDGRISSEYSEIIITRRMYRNGESEYKLNNSNVRLKDIIDITRDTGIGKEGYSIIGQGKIDEILSSKPVQRRHVFEEAAGIMKYRARKEEAEKKLEKTNENLVRVEDILAELNSRLEPLKEQAERTREYLSLFDRQRALDANIYLINERKFSERTNKLSIEISQTEAEINRISREFGEVADVSDELNKQLDEAMERENLLNEKSAELGGAIERLNGEANLIKERIANIETQIQSMNEEIESLTKSISEVDEGIESKQGLFDELNEEIAICDAGIANTEEKRQSLISLSEGHSKKISDAKTRQLDIMGQLSSRNSEFARINAEKEGAQGRAQELKDRLERTNADCAARRKLIEKANERVKDFSAEKLDVSAKINESNMLVMKNKEAEKSIEEKLSAEQGKITDAQGRLRLMNDLKSEYDGYNDSVRNLMKSIKNRPELKNRVIGTIAELITVPKEYETAIETFLGAQLQNIVVRDEYDAKALIEHLRREKLGRITFLPVNALKVTEFSNKELEKLNACDGFIAPAHEVLSYDESVAPAIEFVLSKTALTRDLDSSIKIMRELEQSIKTVTLLGDVTRPGGVMTGGSVNKRNFGLLSRDRIMNELSAGIMDMQSRIAEIKSQLDQKHEETERLNESMRHIMEQLKNIDISLAEERERIASYVSLLEGSEATARSLKNQITAIENEERTLDEDRIKIGELIKYLENASEKVIIELKELETGSEDNSKEISRLTEEVGDLRIRRAELSKEKQAFETERGRLLDEKEKNIAKIESKKRSIEGMSGQKNSLTQEQQNTEESIIEKKQELDEIKESLAQVGEKRRELRGQVVESQRATAEFQEQRTILMERRVKLDAQLDKVKTALENAQNKLWEDYELTMASALQYEMDISYTAAAREAEDVRARIRGLGPVNPKAIEEYQEVSERAADMTTQRDDLIKAEGDLEKIIDELLSGMRSTFAERFAQINDHFMSIFKELFGGGRAELRFEEGDILEAGIEIAAEPPGKKLQQLSLLSGGERALTAIALLFAMIKINPSPVCLLDEIDAPLDEANAVRFAQYLKKIEKTQFMVITHRKPTMSACNALYGVTMEERGVSRMVSVQIDKKKEA